ncbi:MAG TPA: twin-arginine translocase subunit TatC [Planctomycetes bacterium]|nr:twin-arginine translocase subunit TatC [Planctomycetota bacterium]
MNAGEPTDDPFAHTRMSLAEHLDELRSRLIKGLSAILVVFLVAWFFQDEVTRIMARPYTQAMGWLEEYYVQEAEEVLAEHPDRKRTEYFITDDPSDKRLRNFETRLVTIRPGESFLFVLKVCFYISLIVGSPVLLWQMWQFIAAGLYPKEKRAIVLYFPFSLLAFLSGILFGYFWIVPYGMYFLNRTVSIEVSTPSITVQYFLTFLTGLCLVFGLVFQLPLLMTFLASVGMLDPRTITKYRGHFVVGAFVVAAILTPPDPFTQAMMAVPLVILFEIGIWCAKAAARRRAPGLGEGA